MKFLVIMFTLISILFLSGCGNTGPLYQPDKNNDKKQSKDSFLLY